MTTRSIAIVGYNVFSAARRAMLGKFHFRMAADKLCNQQLLEPGLSSHFRIHIGW